MILDNILAVGDSSILPSLYNLFNDLHMLTKLFKVALSLSTK